MSSDYKSYFYSKFFLIYFITLSLFIIVDIIESGRITLFSFGDRWNFILYQIGFCLIAIGFFTAFLANLLWKIKRVK
ncbi:hypothetical protein [Priestia megaterium]|uniref:hypothetical protein n=1 Tax=Priestia megaterium TaxID=1404 RepID=UPI000BFA6851|nr:hypothetical protein [Priestia megaterium]MCM3153680.1 hypothetical protein [Priestia megaterium]PEU70131.1 hypothetical protein CN397_11140 [Priestia megaterium]PFQ78525.1 hypothetical protein COK11_23165 [Priestia megaterium]PFW50228.1 hypothetical protein COL17_09445 [Priestia megaterium]PGR03913.1 hypothetical protein COA23_20875 [Priestia megaterium]